MHELTELIRQDMRPALGVTEPSALPFPLPANTLPVSSSR